MAEVQPTATTVTREPLIARIDRGIYRFARHWLMVVNLLALFLAAVPILTPYLAAQGFTGISNVFHAFFGLICHQIPGHSFHLHGEQLALCQRCIAMYVASFLAGVAYIFIRDRLSPLGFRGLALLAAPMAIDGLTQLFGLRESTWELRVITGSLFATGVMWFALPRLESGFAEIRGVVEQRFRRLVRQGKTNPL